MRGKLSEKEWLAGKKKRGGGKKNTQSFTTSFFLQSDCKSSSGAAEEKRGLCRQEVLQEKKEAWRGIRGGRIGGKGNARRLSLRSGESRGTREV